MLNVSTTTSIPLTSLKEIPSLSQLKELYPHFKAVCFDMDGTLLNSEPLHAQAVWQMLPQKPVVVGDNSFVNEDELNHFFCGHCDGDVFEALKPGQPQWESWQLKDFSLAKNSNLMVGPKDSQNQSRFALLGNSLKPEMLRLLKELKRAGIPCALVSASQVEVVNDFVIALGLDKYFDVWIGATDEALTKPHPDPYLMACSRLGVNPQEAFAFEDSATGLKSALNAGLKTIKAEWF